MTTHRLAAAAATVTLTAALTACGGGGSPAVTTVTVTSTPATPPASGTGSAPASGSGSATGATTAATPTTASTTSAAAKRDATQADLMRAQIPATCRQPALTLENGRMPDSHRPAFGAIGAPFASADLDGDGAKEIAGVYTCSAGGVMWPAIVVVARAGGATLGTVDLARGKEHSTVEELKANGSTFALRWRAYEGAAFDPRGYAGTLRMTGGRLVLVEGAPPAPTPSATTPGAPTSAAPAPVPGGGSASAVTGITEFASPSGNVMCILSKDGASCTIDKKTFTAPPNRGCDGQWGRTLWVGGGAPATFQCKQDAFAGTSDRPSWWDAGRDTKVTSMGMTNRYALGYGHVLTAGNVSCSIDEKTGVTCAQGAHGYTLSRDRYRTW